MFDRLFLGDSIAQRPGWGEKKLIPILFDQELSILKKLIKIYMMISGRILILATNVLFYTSTYVIPNLIVKYAPKFIEV